MLASNKQYQIDSGSHMVRDEDGVRFHIESEDYFASLATILKLWPLLDDTSTSIKEIEKDLMFLQGNYYIVPKSSRITTAQKTKQNNIPKGRLQNQ